MNVLKITTTPIKLSMSSQKARLKAIFRNRSWELFVPRPV